MSNLRSQVLDKRGQRAQRRGFDLSVLSENLGVLLIVLSVGPVIWGINGGFSVAGLEIVAQSFNSAGALIWGALSLLVVDVPVTIRARLPHVPATQPVLPWLIVVGNSLLQCTLLYRTLTGKKISLRLTVLAGVASAYDLGTTFYGLSLLAWVIAAGPVAQGTMTAFLCFSVETALALFLARITRRE